MSDADPTEADVYARRARRLLANGEAETYLVDKLRKYDAMEKELGTLRDLAHIGLATEILGHQFESSIMHTRDCMDMLPADVKATKNYEWLKQNFEELYQHISFMSPLAMQYGRNYQNITGKKIKSYLMAFYARALKSGAITLTITDRFLNFTVNDLSYRLLPVFVALVNNSRYWVEQGGPDRNEILIDMLDNGSVIISDSGPGVHAHMLPTLFKPLHTARVRGGRGLGLYLCRTHLTDMRGTIEYAPNHPDGLGGATFVITFTPPKVYAEDE